VWLGYFGAMLFAASLVVAGAWRLIETQRKAPAISVPDRVLLAHQISKFEHPTATTLFLGDSSLGNAISAARWAELSGHSAANLALTGVYGYAGSYNFLRRALQRGRPDNVVIMHTADMPTRAVWDRAYELTKPEPNSRARRRRRSRCC
jgi:hypothetical protein